MLHFLSDAHTGCVERENEGEKKKNEREDEKGTKEPNINIGILNILIASILGTEDEKEKLEEKKDTRASVRNVYKC